MDETIRRYGILVRPPGESFDYSNLDYGPAVGEYAIERISGKSYSDFVRDEVFQPLGLSESAVSLPPDLGNKLATRYWGNHALSRPYDYDARGAAAASMSAHDLLRFGMFHLQGSLDGQRKSILRQSTLSSMRDTEALNNGEKNAHGIGWMVENDMVSEMVRSRRRSVRCSYVAFSVPGSGCVVVVVLGNGVSVVGADPLP